MKRIPDHGTSLLEMLVSLAVLSMLATAMVATMNTGINIWQRGPARDTQSALVINRAELRRLLELLPLPLSLQGSPAVLHGTSNSLHFLLPAYVFEPANPGISKVHLEIRSPGNQSVLWLSAKMGETIFIDGPISGTLDQIEISYLRKTLGPVDEAWSNDWQDPHSLPLLVKVEMIGRGRFEPPLTIQPARLARQRRMSLSDLLPPG